VNVYRVELTPKVTNVCWLSSAPVEIVLTNSYAPGGITWSGTNGLKVISATDAKLVFTPTNSVATNYAVKAEAMGFPNCYDVCTVNVYRVELTPDATNVCWLSSNPVEIVLTNSYAPGGITWSGINGLKVVSATDAKLVFTPTNSVATNYAVKATATGFPNCYDTATVNVYRVELTPKATNVCWLSSNPVEIVLTNSYAPGGITWSGTNGLKVVSATDAKLVFTPTNSVATNYAVKATATAFTNCYDTATVTVLKVEIEKCASGFWPEGGTNDNTTTIRAFVTPSTAKGKFKFTLFEVSDEPGYCMNAPPNVPAAGEDSDAWKDFQFPTQSFFTVSGPNSNIAETVSNDIHEATVTIKSFDYGSFGKVKAEFTTQDGSLTCVGKEVGGTNEYTRLPADTNLNDISDSWSGDIGPSGNWDATYDDDNNPTNGYTTGDGLSRYEEYRGFSVNGFHTRTIPWNKDVFICDVGNAFASNRADVSQLGCNIHWIGVDEWDGASSDASPTYQHINFNCDSHRARTYLQRALRLLDGGSNGTKTWGQSFRDLPRCPNNTMKAVVYTGNISTYWTNTPSASEVITRTVAHELAHGCGLTDDYLNPDGIMSEYTAAGSSNVWHVFRSGTGAGTLDELRICYP
jgi:hypothetical protein